MKKYIYSSDNLAPSNKKMSTVVTDFAAVFFMSLGVSIGGVQILTNNASYKEDANIIDGCVEDLDNLCVDAHLKTYYAPENRNKTVEEMLKEYAVTQILLSYDNNESVFNEAGISDLHNYKFDNTFSFESATEWSDYLSYFYVNYLPSLGENNPLNYSTQEQGISFYLNLLIEEKVDMSDFIMSDGYPVLKAESAIEIFNYMYVNAKKESSAYNHISSLFTKVYGRSSKEVTKLDAYKAIFNVYDVSYRRILGGICVVFSLSYLIAAVIEFLILPLILGNGRTLGNLLTKTLISKENEKAPIKSILIRFALNFLMYFLSSFTVAMMVTGATPFSLPLFYIGNVGVSMFWFIILSVIVIAANLITGLVSKSKRTLIEIASQTVFMSVVEDKPVENKEVNEEKDPLDPSDLVNKEEPLEADIVSEDVKEESSNDQLPSDEVNAAQGDNNLNEEK